MPPLNSTTSSDGLISIRGLTRRFGEHVAVHPTEIAIGAEGRGSITGLLGPNGSGKSTLLRMLVGLVAPQAGSARVDGVELSGDGTAIRKRCSFSPGELSLYVEMRGDEHLRWFLRGRDREAPERAIGIAEELGLPLQKPVRTYSHGMKRMLVFAAALAPRLSVRILDEPTEGLDPHKRARVLDLISADAERGTTILLSSHHLGEVDRVCETMVFLSEGRVLAVEHSDEVRERARRSVRMTFDESADLEAVERVLSRCSRVVVEGTAVRAHVEQEDPRELLAALASARELPIPRSLEYGSLSLEELYRDLYGVEGV